MSESFSLSMRVYYEDTDAGGVVYHASYVRFFERARAEYIRHLDIPGLWPPRDMVFVVRSLSLEYLRPAYLDDLLHVDAKPLRRGRVYVDFAQTVSRAGEMLVTGEVRLVCASGSPLRACSLPPALSAVMDGEIS